MPLKNHPVFATKTSKLIAFIEMIGIYCEKETKYVKHCVDKTWNFLIPPLLVFPRIYVQQELMNRTPHGPIHACHFSGWIESEIFTQWFLHFIRHTKPTK